MLWKRRLVGVRVHGGSWTRGKVVLGFGVKLAVLRWDPPRSSHGCSSSKSVIITPHCRSHSYLKLLISIQNMTAGPSHCKHSNNCAFDTSAFESRHRSEPILSFDPSLRSNKTNIQVGDFPIVSEHLKPLF